VNCFKKNKKNQKNSLPYKPCHFIFCLATRLSIYLSPSLPFLLPTKRWDFFLLYYYYNNALVPAIESLALSAAQTSISPESLRRTSPQKVVIAGKLCQSLDFRL